MHESSLLGKPELHEELNIQVLPFLFRDHQNDVDDMDKFFFFLSNKSAIIFASFA